MALFLLPTALKAHWLASNLRLARSAADLANGWLLLVIGVLAAVLPLRLGRLTLAGGALMASLLIFADAVHYRAYGDVITLHEMGQAFQLREFYSGIWPYVRLGDLWLVAELPLWILLFLAKPPETMGVRLRWSIWLPAVLVILGAYGAWLYDFTTSLGRLDEAPLRNHRFVIRDKGALNYHVIDAFQSLRPRLVRPINGPDLERVRSWFAARPPAGKELVPREAVGRWNVISIQVESLEAVVIGLRIKGEEVTPNLNRLVNKSYYFNRFFPQSGYGITADAEFIALNSLLPARDSAVVYRYRENQFHSLPAILREHGYATVAMHPSRPNFWNIARMHRVYGFERSYAYETFALGHEPPGAIPDDRLLKQCRELLRAQRAPFFAHILTISSHTPFRWIRPDQRTLHLAELEATTLGDYLQSVHYVDSAIGRFLDGLKADGREQDTVICIYGDHEALPVEERQRVQPYESDLTGRRLDLSLRPRVPLILFIPGVKRVGDGSSPLAGQIDLAPTLLQVLGIPDGEARFLGRSLFREAPPLVYFRSGDFATEREYFASPDGTFEHGACQGIEPGAKADPAQCERTFRHVQQSIWVSDTILEQNLVPVLLKGTTATGSKARPGDRK